MGKRINSWLLLPRHAKTINNYRRGQAVPPPALEAAKKFLPLMISGSKPATQEAIRVASNCQRILLDYEARLLKISKRGRFLEAVGQFYGEAWNKGDFIRSFHNGPFADALIAGEANIDTFIQRAERLGLSLDQLADVSRFFGESLGKDNLLVFFASSLCKLSDCLEMIRTEYITTPQEFAQHITELLALKLEEAPQNLYSIYARGLNKGFTHEQIINLLNIAHEVCSSQLSARLTRIDRTDWEGSKANQTSATTQARIKYRDQFITANEILEEMMTSNHQRLGDFSSFHKEFGSVLEEVVKDERISRWWNE